MHEFTNQLRRGIARVGARALPSVLGHMAAIRDRWNPQPKMIVSDVSGGDTLQRDTSGRHTIHFTTQVDGVLSSTTDNIYVLDLVNQVIDFQRTRLPNLQPRDPEEGIAGHLLARSPIIRLLQPIFTLREAYLLKREDAAMTQDGVTASEWAFRQALYPHLSKEVRDALVSCQHQVDHLIRRVQNCSSDQEALALLRECDRAPAPLHLASDLPAYMQQVYWIHPSGLQIAKAVLTFPRFPHGSRTAPDVQIEFRIGGSGDALYEMSSRYPDLDTAEKEGPLGVYRETLTRHPLDDEDSPFST